MDRKMALGRALAHAEAAAKHDKTLQAVRGHAAPEVTARARASARFVAEVELSRMWSAIAAIYPEEG